MVLNTDKIVKLAQEYASLMTEEAKRKLLLQMKKRDTEVGGRGQLSLNLAQSIAAIVTATADRLDVGIGFDDYGMFVDKGVKGAESVYLESSQSPFQFKDKQPPTKVFAGATGWIARKAIIDRGAIRRETGKRGKALTKAVIAKNKSLAFVIARSIRKKGIKAYHFSDAVTNKRNEFIDKLAELVSADIIEKLKIEIKNK